MKPTLKPIEEQAVVIVGCSSGIGRQVARRFAERGAKLVLSARDEAALADVLDDVRALGAPDAIAVPADVADPGQLREVARRAVEAFGRIDTWFQGAAASLYATFEETTPEEFRRVIEVNLLGQAYGAMAALPHLRAGGGGALIEVSSVEAEVPLPYQSAYASSKHGMAGFLRALRMEMKAEGAPIAITQILPAGIDTPLFVNARTKLGVEPKPTAPIYDPDVVADLVLHAAEHPSDDLYAGGAGMLFSFLRRVFPGTSEAVLARMGMPMQRTEKAKSVEAPDNLHAPLAHTDKVRGGYGGRRRSFGTVLQTTPVMPVAAAMAALAAIVVLRRR
jgi:NAD(P)-dependent dehydrogenase (short-subunit alcohol dehydrogenase family)